MNGAGAGGTGERFTAAALDHFAARLGYLPVPETRPSSGGWRRLYVHDGAEAMLAAVGPEDGGWVSVGVEIAAPRTTLERRLPRLLEALAPYEVAVDPDAGADREGHDAVLRLALRLFADGLTPAVFEAAVGNLIEAFGEARRRLA
jgi:hypothetical protein